MSIMESPEIITIVVFNTVIIVDSQTYSPLEVENRVDMMLEVLRRIFAKEDSITFELSHCKPLRHCNGKKK